ncbi:branched-chain amino acid ABC transporter permease [Egibacter rhizosphaerae]|uniref:Branched-chain amino acid ABC transporter permease n=1 Tax=Egibacter rhizosphaerae TaxID=1670831 RepID=A0A411YKF1_9ACTN|nr:branched-chain amino acid ABC transporter permease [Egibacter rhizosphaerae]QBI21666.1 branched-chain amino acid ABC transporter permease [Egibacter rhizosphaerae]
MTQLLQTLISGLGQGAAYSLIAVGFVIIFKSTHVISFAQPALMAAGATAVALLTVQVGLNFYLAVLVAVVAAAIAGLGIERAVLRPMVGKPVFIIAIITLGLDVVIRVITNRFIGADVRPMGDPWGLERWELGALTLQHRHAAALITTAAILSALYLFFRYSRIGLAMRATAFDQETSLAQGVNVGHMFGISWALAAALAAVAGVFIGAGSTIDQQTWYVGLKALPAIILGGLDSIPGAVVGGLAVGVVEALFATYQSTYLPFLGSNFSIVAPYALMLVVLLVRPYGLFGTPEIQRV